MGMLKPYVNSFTFGTVNAIYEAAPIVIVSILPAALEYISISTPGNISFFNDTEQKIHNG